MSMGQACIAYTSGCGYTPDSLLVVDINWEDKRSRELECVKPQVNIVFVISL